MAKMTPGPWKVRDRDKRTGCIYVGPETEDVVTVHACPSPSVTEANARAIAALPELIEAAERLANAYFKIAMRSVDYGDYLSMRRMLARIEGGE